MMSLSSEFEGMATCTQEKDSYKSIFGSTVGQLTRVTMRPCPDEHLRHSTAQAIKYKKEEKVQKICGSYPNK